MQLASLEVVTQSSSFIGLPQYVSFMPGLATWTLPSPLAGGYSPVVNVSLHDRHLTPLGSCWHGDASGVAYPKDDSPFSIGYGLLRKPLHAVL